MQKMSEAEGDTHDHGPPNTIKSQAKTALKKHTPYPRLAVWSTNLSDASVNAFSGAMAGMASGIVTCPLDVIKTKLQAQGSFANPGVRGSSAPPAALYHGMIGTARTIIRQDGLVGMYRGLGPMLLGYLPTWAVYMTVYDSSKDYFARHGYNDNGVDKFKGQVYSSITAGACSTLATNPIWVIKTRFMSQVSRTAGSDGARTPWHYTSTLDAARQMYRAEGMAAFYSGLAPALLGLSHVAIQFPLYEYFKQRFTGLEMGEAPTQHNTSSAEGGSKSKNTLGILAATFLSKVCATSATYPHEVLRTRLQTQQRHVQPESSANGVATNHHSQSLHATGRRVGNTDGAAYQPRYRGTIKTARIILQQEGWRAFYSGMGTNMMRAVPAAMTTMLTFESIKGLLGRMREEGKEILRGEEG